MFLSDSLDGLDVMGGHDGQGSVGHQILFRIHLIFNMLKPEPFYTHFLMKDIL